LRHGLRRQDRTQWEKKKSLIDCVDNEKKSLRSRDSFSCKKIIRVTKIHDAGTAIATALLLPFPFLATSFPLPAP
jgi:hypothetical protein